MIMGKLSWKDVAMLILFAVALFGTWATKNITDRCVDKFQEECMYGGDGSDNFYNFKLRLDDQAYLRLHERFEFGLSILSTQSGIKYGTRPIDILNHIEETSVGDCDDRSVYAYLLLNEYFPDFNDDMWVNVGILNSWEADTDGFNRSQPIIPDHAWLEINGTVEDLAWTDNATHIPFYRVKIDNEEMQLNYQYYCENVARAYGNNMTASDEAILAQMDCVGRNMTGNITTNETNAETLLTYIP